MYRFNKLYLVSLLLLLSMPVQPADSPVIAAAASVKFALMEIGDAFREDTGETVRFSFASSGNLTRQIQQGAPFELFLSANTAYVELLQKQKLTQNNKVVYALGRLVLMTTVDSPLQLDGQLQGIKQAAQFASSRAAQAGLISNSVALTPALQKKRVMFLFLHIFTARLNKPWCF